MSYTVETHKEGRIIRGELPSGDLIALINKWLEEEPGGVFDVKIADAVRNGGSCFAYARSCEASKRWRAELGIPEES